MFRSTSLQDCILTSHLTIATLTAVLTAILTATTAVITLVTTLSVAAPNTVSINVVTCNMNNMDGTSLPPACADRVRKENELKALQRDPYVLAHRYTEYMEQHPMRHQLEGRQFVNRYYENLLANQPEPDLEATDKRSRAIRYAKEHFECYYEIKDVARIIRWLDEAEDRPVAVDMTSLLNRIWSSSQESSQVSQEQKSMAETSSSPTSSMGYSC